MFQVGDKVVATGCTASNNGEFHYGYTQEKWGLCGSKSVMVVTHRLPNYSQEDNSEAIYVEVPNGKNWHKNWLFHPAELRYATPAEIEAAERAKLPEIPDGFTRWEAKADSVSPVGPDVMTEVVFANGAHAQGAGWVWNDRPRPNGLIIAYRIVEEAPAPAADAPEAVGEIRKGMFVKHAKLGVGFVFGTTFNVDEYRVAFPDREEWEAIKSTALTPLF